MRIDFLVQDRRAYTFENYASSSLAICFQEFGIKTRKIVLEDGSFSAYLLSLHHEAPDYTISFEDFFKHQKPFCDITRIPHLFWERSSLANSIHFVDSSFAKVGFVDRRLSKKFSLPFLAHPFPDILERSKEKLFEVVLFADLIDVENKIETWKTLFSEEGVGLLLKGVEICHEDLSLHPVEVALSIWKENTAISLNDLIFGIEEYLQAERTLPLIESFTNVKIDVFGDHVGNNWLRRLKNAEQVRLHGSLPYTEHLEVLKLSKILVRHQAPYAEASDEWVLPALSTGCMVLSNKNPYLEEQLKDSSFFYENLGDLQKKLLFYLNKPFYFSQKEWLLEHSWQKRTETILDLITYKHR